MGCNNSRNFLLPTSRFEVENEIREWESNTEFTDKLFVDVVYEINMKVFSNGEMITENSFIEYFNNNFKSNKTKEIISNNFFFDSQNYNMQKIKHLAYLLTIPNKTTTNKGKIFYDKANYMFAYIKEKDDDTTDFFSKKSVGLQSFLESLINISLIVIPNVLKVDCPDTYKKIAGLDLENKFYIIQDNLIDELFKLATTKNRDQLTIDELNQVFDKSPGILCSAYIRNFALETIN